MAQITDRAKDTINQRAYAFIRSAEILADPTESEPQRQSAFNSLTKDLGVQATYPDDINDVVAHANEVGEALCVAFNIRDFT